MVTSVWPCAKPLEPPTKLPIAPVDQIPNRPTYRGVCSSLGDSQQCVCVPRVLPCVPNAPPPPPCYSLSLPVPPAPSSTPVRRAASDVGSVPSVFLQKCFNRSCTNTGNTGCKYALWNSSLRPPPQTSPAVSAYSPYCILRRIRPLGGRARACVRVCEYV